MVRLVDTHCHLNLLEHFPEPEREIERAREAGIDRLIVVGIDEQSNIRALELADRHQWVFAVVGWHPNSAATYSADVLKQVEEWARHPKAVAIGEIGLDYHWDFATREQQERCLIDQLDLAASMSKPVVFHCRDAYPDLLSGLEARSEVTKGTKSHEVHNGDCSTPNTQHPTPNTRLLFHCFSGDAQDLRRAMSLDAYFGVDGPITYKKAHALRELIKQMPKNRIMLETDSPYLSPEPFRGKPNSPANIAIINRAMASTLAISPEESAALTTSNAERFFGL